MFNVGPGELIAILALALIVLGPQRLPEAVRTVGRVVGELRRISSGFQEELRNALDDSEVERDLDRLRASSTIEPPEPPALPVVEGEPPAPEDLVDDQKDAGDGDDGKDPEIDDDPEPFVVEATEPVEVVEAPEPVELAESPEPAAPAAPEPSEPASGDERAAS
jgi:sec-independent protein translocase protein TatB